MSSWRLVVVFTCLLAGVGSSPSRGQSTPDNIQSRLIDHDLYLRGAWVEDKLKFNEEGLPEKNYHTGPGSVAGIKVTSVDVHGDEVRIRGSRVAVLLNKPDGPQRLVIPISARDTSPETIQIEIKQAKDGDFSRALDAIFSAEMPSTLSVVQNPEKRPTCLPNQKPSCNVVIDEKANLMAPVAADGTTTGAAHVGGSVKAPKLLKSVDPNFSEAARKLKFSGDVQLYLHVDTDGKTSHIRVVKPVGCGLDEQAIAAVQQYLFAPATKDGQPVVVDLYINVNFQIF